MKELIKNWYRINNNHPCDNERFYKIVIESIDSKIDEETFQEALHEVDEHIANDTVSEIYIKYELLRSFIIYYNNR